MKLFLVPMIALFASTFAYSAVKTERYVGTNNIMGTSGECTVTLATNDDGQIVGFSARGKYRLWMMVTHAMVPGFSVVDHGEDFMTGGRFEQKNFQVEKGWLSDDLILTGSQTERKVVDTVRFTLKMSNGTPVAAKMKIKSDVAGIPWYRSTFECVDLRLSN